MAIPTYLAMTAGEFLHFSRDRREAAWMACHFSPYGTGLTNLPGFLPEGSLLILNDRIPFSGHDFHRVCAQLQQCVNALGCRAVLLDFQRPEAGEVLSLCEFLIDGLPCSVAVSEAYGKELSCPLFLPPCPHHIPLPEYIQPWAGRELWLDLAVDAETITVTSSGAQILPFPLGEFPQEGHLDPQLHCHYRIAPSDNAVRFTLWRSREDLEALTREAEKLGILALVGLYQELK